MAPLHAGTVPALCFGNSGGIVRVVFRCWSIIILKRDWYSRRQMIFFSLSAVVIVIGVVVSLRIPLEFQSMVDSIETQQNN